MKLSKLSPNIGASPLGQHARSLLRLAYDHHIKISAVDGVYDLRGNAPDIEGSEGEYNQAFLELIEAGYVHQSSTNESSTRDLAAFQPTSAGITELIRENAISPPVGDHVGRTVSLHVEHLSTDDRHWKEYRISIQCDATKNFVGVARYAIADLAAAEEAGDELPRLLNACPFSGYEEIGQDQWGFDIEYSGLPEIYPLLDDIPDRLMIIHQIKVNALNLGFGYGSAALYELFKRHEDNSVMCFLSPFPLNHSRPSKDPDFLAGLRSLTNFYTNHGFTSFAHTKRTLARFLQEQKNADT